jgi:hypothetical protein
MTNKMTLMNKKKPSEFKKTKAKIAPEYTGLKRTKILFTLFSIILISLAKYEYAQNPHFWYEIDTDNLLVAFGLMCSLFNLYIDISFCIVRDYLKGFSMRLTLISIAFSTVLMGINLFSNPILYLIPFFCLLLIHTYTHIRSTPRLRVVSK